MAKLPPIVAIVLLVAGVVMIVAGATTYCLIHRELSDEHITVSGDATNFRGKPVEGPFTAYAEATVIKKHASEIADGQTYAQLAQDDPRREAVMTSSFLRASLFTSIVASRSPGARRRPRPAVHPGRRGAAGDRPPPTSVSRAHDHHARRRPGRPRRRAGTG